MINFETPKHHWNYFLAIEKDLENIARYIEFSNENLTTYSIELTHILLSASSEVDVIMKQLCYLLDSTQSANNINDYKSVIQKHLPSLISEEVVIDRYGLTLKPWDNWSGENNPIWWRSYNNVKHQRNEHFNEANLKNTINAVSALLLTVVYYYRLTFSKEGGNELTFRETTRMLQPEANFLRINADYYYHNLIG
ncbi:MAG: hypothetical protein ABJE80_22810 [Reichenbachiella sp.]|uniref:hypothetical protein n=1 Tax=Reichenbachiella sp. TaxID=2184521 RepID=UPI0032651CAC